jgi:hypothetical protein
MLEENNAKDELRRIDHLLFVTLKYTRTVDIIKSIIEKFVLALNYQTEEIYEQMLENKKISNIPPVPLVRVKGLEQLYPKDKVVKDIVDYYVMLKKIINSDHRKREEYRKNVTLVTPDKEVNIERLKEYSKITTDYVHYLRGLIHE